MLGDLHFTLRILSAFALFCQRQIRCVSEQQSDVLLLNESVE